MSQTQHQNRNQENDDRTYGRENERARWGSPSQGDARETLGRVLGRLLGEREADPRQSIVERLSSLEQEKQLLLTLLAVVTGVPSQGYHPGTPDILRNLDARTLAQLAGWQENHRPNQASQSAPRHERHRGLRITTKGLNRDDNLVKDEVISDITYLVQHGKIDQEDLIEIDVKVKDGDVTLAGTVTNRDVKLYIEETVGNVIGVKDIRNELRFVPLSAEGNNPRAQQRDPRQPHAS